MSLWQQYLRPQSLADALNAVGETDTAREHAAWLAKHFTVFNETGAPFPWWSNLYLSCSLSILDQDAESLEVIERLVDAPGLPWYPVLKDSLCFQKFVEEPRFLAVVHSIEGRMAALRARLPDTLADFQSVQ